MKQEFWKYEMKCERCGETTVFCGLDKSHSWDTFRTVVTSDMAGFKDGFQFCENCNMYTRQRLIAFEKETSK